MAFLLRYNVTSSLKEASRIPISHFAASYWRQPSSAYGYSMRMRCLHNFALTRQVPNSFVNAVTKYYQVQDDGISMPLAKSQQKEYLSVLRTKVPTLLLPALESHPDSIFVEDTVVAVGGKRAVITWPGHSTRQGEVASIQNVLVEQLGMEVWDMHGRNESAICDGGDVLNTGRHVFVGLSERTNMEGVTVLREAFGSHLPVITVPLEADDALHLKSIVTHVDAYTLMVPQGPLGDRVLKDMDAETLGYQTVRLPDIRACNVVSLNGLIVASANICDESRRKLQDCAQQKSLNIAFVDTSEIHKGDGGCTCCSVLLSL
jgi:dimethylargininase